MDRVRAWEQLHDGEYLAKLRMQEFYDLLIRAGYNRDLAQQAASEHGWTRLAAGEVM